MLIKVSFLISHIHGLGSGFQECPMSDQRWWPKLLPKWLPSRPVPACGTIDTSGFTWTQHKARPTLRPLVLFSCISLFTSVITLCLLPFRYIGYRGNSIFFFFGYKLLRSFILHEFEILKYNFIPPISPTLWPLALSYFSKTAESRIWWFLIGATGKGMLGAGTQMCLQCLRELRTQAPRVLSWVSPMPSIAESPASDFAETSAVAFPFSRTHLQSGLPRLPNKPGSFSCVSVFRWKSLHAKRAHQTPSS